MNFQTNVKGLKQMRRDTLVKNGLRPSQTRRDIATELEPMPIRDMIRTYS